MISGHQDTKHRQESRDLKRVARRGDLGIPVEMDRLGVSSPENLVHETESSHVRSVVLCQKARTLEKRPSQFRRLERASENHTRSSHTV